ncbi:dephospho-CoA kinase [Thermosynechococcus sp. CL-1]|uniref:dephospho-CoA kinase n=1 Tax=unclassified Thermosynechococcus TaxID=2622553 RepID=UPI00122E69D0|nr:MULTISPECIES: dephospho-CoA kinase [unclassified Thermosynechococcus]QEQ00092.1 dephospho-CoA kinase [Thermosynechococcus sp. CL-1]WJI26811.1 dephospho-CoA kinase [Thermosynechococcus sp. B1]WJI29343.1 dephospho-CoA kinase [Thermosynechococcus sp. B3]WKT83923.1 dephospho-CoA kinase [Thermosynechococcus sp. HY596]WNC63055.1 dephospho-CoA kinase [Thermosynechococcus sp. HY591]
MSRPLRLGITGGIACGKSVVAAYLQQQYGVPIVDADVLARQAVAVGTPIYQAIVDRYGHGICRSDGTLDRPRLGEIVFAQPQERHWLEAQIHPWVIAQMQQAIQACDQPLITLVIPLLFEAHLEGLVDQIWVVATTPAQQLARLQQRDRLSGKAAAQRLASQLPLEEKIRRADTVLWNTGSLEELYRQVDQAFSLLGRNGKGG